MGLRISLYYLQYKLRIYVYDELRGDVAQFMANSYVYETSKYAQIGPLQVLARPLQGWTDKAKWLFEAGQKLWQKDTAIWCAFELQESAF